MLWECNLHMLHVCSVCVYSDIILWYFSLTWAKNPKFKFNSPTFYYLVYRIGLVNYFIAIVNIINIYYHNHIYHNQH